MKLPPAEELLATLRAKPRDQWNAVLDQYVPNVDWLADAPLIADYLGLDVRTIYRERHRTRSGGPAWPDPAPVPGRTPLWMWRTILIHRALMPGPGNWTQREDTTDD